MVDDVFGAEWLRSARIFKRTRTSERVIDMSPHAAGCGLSYCIDITDVEMHWPMDVIGFASMAFAAF